MLVNLSKKEIKLVYSLLSGNSSPMYDENTGEISSIVEPLIQKLSNLDEVCTCQEK